MTTAIVKIGDYQATFAGETFVSDDESTANVLNSALMSYRMGASPWPNDYYPNDVAGIARDCARYCGGDLVSFETDEEHVEGRVY